MAGRCKMMKERWVGWPEKTNEKEGEILSLATVTNRVSSSSLLGFSSRAQQRPLRFLLLCHIDQSDQAPQQRQSPCLDSPHRQVLCHRYNLIEEESMEGKGKSD
ncbi:hypothetical protein CKAN_00688600 [Cinnamomum micranthum f. kanehirae]|uniref:Uncharacterized protein n=1 Tax=Cinnamomum micranthum f. kanehirae TaxID=337451 RepID=A0A443NIJ0_9MAGN|nr:hypothetical protein CKAN_00688600 [Cinnamomum micranthum f. kanehirae]